MGVCRPGAFVDLDGGPCGLWGRLARYGACNCRSGVPPPDSAAGMVSPYWAARCAVGEFAGGHEPPGRSPRRRGGGRSTPNGMLQRTLMGVLMGPANRPGLDAADRRHPGMGGGPDLRTPVGVLAALLGCYVAGGNGRRRESGLRATPARGGGQGLACRRRIRRREAVPPIGGTVLWCRPVGRHGSLAGRHAAGQNSAAWYGAADRRHGIWCRPVGRHGSLAARFRPAAEAGGAWGGMG